MTTAGSAKLQLDCTTAALALGAPGTRGCTLLEIVVVMALSLLLAGLVMPYQYFFMRERSGCGHRVKCGNNGRQIATAMQVYANDYDGVWPVRLTGPDGKLARPGMPIDDRLTTIATFEFLSVYSGGDLTAKLFTCPSAAVRPAIPSADPKVGTGGLDDHSAWATALASQQPHYAYDWTAPKESLANRAVIACRPLTGTVTQHTVNKTRPMTNVIFADCRVANLNASGPGTGRRTIALDGKPYLNAHLNKDAANDDIFAADGTPSLPGAGSPTRAWLR